ncbi:YbaB/EbfC family nucleoid-associated protein [Microbacterium sp. P04]|uniref:YbaB/EbfC family nucleoid-associated protein n=1 Tax=Microbacterium sp. P04 TaxID=3366947 RepID=UPI0037469190
METSEEVQEALRRINAQAAQAVQNAERMQQLAGEIQQISAEVTSPGNELSIQVDVGGRLTDVRFTAAALSLRPDQLSKLLLDALEEGYRRTSEASVALAESALGENSATVAGIRSNAETYAPKIRRNDEGIVS